MERQNRILKIALLVVFTLLVLSLTAGPKVGLNAAPQLSPHTGRPVDGYMNGWEVTVGGEIVCSDPYMWRATKEIECDEDERY